MKNIMKYNFLICLLCIYICSVNFISAQDSSSISVLSLKNHMRHIASDNTEGRMTGSFGFKKAAKYSADVFRDAGLEPGYRMDDGNNAYLQPIQFKYENGKNSQLKIIQKDTAFIFTQVDTNFIVLDKGRGYKNSICNPVFIGYGINDPDLGWDDYKNLQIEGKWVILISGSQWEDSFHPLLPRSVYEKYRNDQYRESHIHEVLKQKNVSGIIIIPDNNLIENWLTIASKLTRKYNHIKSLENYQVMQNDPNPDIPIILAHPNLINILFDNYQYNTLPQIDDYNTFELDKTVIEINIDVQIDTITCYNVIATVPGIDTSLNHEYITIGAHLDHLGKFVNDVFNGANDDASGCVVILEAAKELAQHPAKRSVMFILYTGEELNSYGSQHFLKHPTIPTDSILFNVNLEQLGSMNRTVKGLWLIGDSLFIPYFYNSVDFICRKELIFDNTEEYRKALRSTDCRSYFDADIPTMMLSSGGFEEYHTRYDDIELIDFEHMRFATEFLYSFISKMANDPLLFKK